MKLVQFSDRKNKHNMNYIDHPIVNRHPQQIGKYDARDESLQNYTNKYFECKKLKL